MHLASSPQFRRFERVVITAMPAHHSGFVGQVGTVIWVDPSQRSGCLGDWAYCVSVPAMGCHVTALESGLRSLGGFDLADTHLGTRHEISHDLVPDERGEFSFVEGTYRTPGKFWEVMIFTKADVPTLQHRFGTWESGIGGVTFRVPKDDRLDKAYVLRAMSRVFERADWVEVSGPDSMVLRQGFCLAGTRDRGVG
jgi:hypothetical protein